MGGNADLPSMLSQTKTLANVAAVVALVGGLFSVWQFAMYYQEMFTWKGFAQYMFLCLVVFVMSVLCVAIEASGYRITNKLKEIRFHNAGWLVVSMLFLLLSLGAFGPCEVGEFGILIILQVFVLGRSLAINSHDLDQLTDPESGAVGL